MKHAWEWEYELLQNAVPADFTDNPSDWSAVDAILASRKAELFNFWESEVPGSRAPEHLYVAMIQAWGNRGFDVTRAEEYIPEALRAAAEGDWGRLEHITGRIMLELRRAEILQHHPYWTFKQYERWPEILDQMEAHEQPQVDPLLSDEELEERIHRGWVGQIAGASYGTALEGYLGAVLEEVYGERLNGYIKEPETYNDDITYELATLSAVLEHGKEVSSMHIADKWLEMIPFGWSAEYTALQNLRRGVYPPDSGIDGNFFCEWIGAQMRTMVCGFIYPGDPLKAARLAYEDSRVSHHLNGVYGGIHAAVLTSLAFTSNDPKEVVEESLKYIPKGTEFHWILERAIQRAKQHKSSAAAWNSAQDELKTYNWIHAYPNMVANVTALWFCEGDMTKAFRILAGCGLDVDCNAGTVGSVLGVMHPVPELWSEPIADRLQTYIPGMEELSIRGIAALTMRAVRMCRS